MFKPREAIGGRGLYADPEAVAGPRGSATPPPVRPRPESVHGGRSDPPVSSCHERDPALE